MTLWKDPRGDMVDILLGGCFATGILLWERCSEVIIMVSTGRGLSVIVDSGFPNDAIEFVENRCPVVHIPPIIALALRLLITWLRDSLPETVIEPGTEADSGKESG